MEDTSVAQLGPTSKQRPLKPKKMWCGLFITNGNKTDDHKKAEDRVKKADEALKKAEAMPIAEKKKEFDTAEAARKEGETKYNQLKADYDAAVANYNAAKAAGYDGDLCTLAVVEVERIRGENDTAMSMLDQAIVSGARANRKFSRTMR